MSATSDILSQEPFSYVLAVQKEERCPNINNPIVTTEML